MSNYSENTLNLEAGNTSWAKIFNFVPEGSVVLDIGCSSGNLGKELKQQKNCMVDGTELDKGDVAAAKKVLDNVFLCNIETDPLPKEIADKKYDVIIFADVIEHLVDPVSALQLVGKLLKSGGRVVFSIPNMSHISVRLQLLAGKFAYNETGLLDKTHLHFYDQNEVKRVFAEANYQIVDLDANMLPYPKSFMKKRINELGLGDEGFVEKMSADQEAFTFQFVGYATKLAKGEKAQPVVQHSSTPEDELPDYIESLRQLAIEKETVASEQHKRLEQLEAENVALKQQIEKTMSSITWKVGRTIVGPPGKLVAKRRKRKAHND